MAARPSGHGFNRAENAARINNYRTAVGPSGAFGGATRKIVKRVATARCLCRGFLFGRQTSKGIPAIMKLVSYSLSGKTGLGALSSISGDSIVDLSRAHRELMGASRGLLKARHVSRPLPTEMLTFLQRGVEALRTAQEALEYIEGQLAAGAKQEYLRQGTLLPLATTTLLAPVPPPSQAARGLGELLRSTAKRPRSRLRKTRLSSLRSGRPPSSARINRLSSRASARKWTTRQSWRW